VITARKLFNWAVEENDKGNPFPVSNTATSATALPAAAATSAVTSSMSTSAIPYADSTCISSTLLRMFITEACPAVATLKQIMVSGFPTSQHLQTLLPRLMPFIEVVHLRELSAAAHSSIPAALPAASLSLPPSLLIYRFYVPQHTSSRLITTEPCTRLVSAFPSFSPNHHISSQQIHGTCMGFQLHLCMLSVTLAGWI
jgi:hypothetical protein